jgi:lipoprotein-anchoring transpeptidase ErfK/SrfK
MVLKRLVVAVLLALLVINVDALSAWAAADPDEADLSLANGKALVVDQSTQIMRVFEGASLVRLMPVSTGIDRYHTPAFKGRVGHYVSSFHGYGSSVDHAWYITRVAGNIYIHGAPYSVRDGRKVYEDIDFLGVQPSSHGCVRIHPTDAEWLLEWDPIGAQIVITAPVLGYDWQQRTISSVSWMPWSITKYEIRDGYVLR